jgi:hypothetical protein
MRAAGARRRARRPRQLQPWPGRQAATVTALRLRPGRGPGHRGPGARARRARGGRRVAVGPAAGIMIISQLPQ